jgi:hypothetical protein
MTYSSREYNPANRTVDFTPSDQFSAVNNYQTLGTSSPSAINPSETSWFSKNTTYDPKTGQMVQTDPGVMDMAGESIGLGTSALGLYGGLQNTLGWFGGTSDSEIRDKQMQAMQQNMDALNEERQYIKEDRNLRKNNRSALASALA